MLRSLAGRVTPSSLLGGAIFSGLFVANRLTLKDDPQLVRYRDLAKPLSSARPDASPAAAAMGPCSDVYTATDIPRPLGTFAMPCPDSGAGSGGGRGATLVSTMEASCRRFGPRRAMGVRAFSGIEKQSRMTDGKPKTWDVYHFGQTRYYTYAELWEHIEAFGRGLMAVGLSPNANVALCEETRMEWFVACYGVWYAGATGCTVYANMNGDALDYALAQMAASVVVCNGSNLPQFVRFFTSDAHKGPVPTIIYTDALPDGFAPPPNFGRIIAYEEVLARGRASKTKPHEPRSADDTALIMYTSGTTGKPKGVMMSHRNILATIRSIGAAVDHLFGDRSDITYLAYLPLAHILEFACENTLLHRGMLLGYGHPRSLTNLAASPHGDLTEFQPHFMCGVPRVFDSIRKTVYERLGESPIARTVFGLAYADKVRLMRRGKDTPLYNKLLFNRVKANLGGRIEAVLSGGAPLSPEAQQFIQTTVTSSMIQGYGLTETCACTAVQFPGDRTKQCAGVLLPGVEAKLRDTADWKHTNTPLPRGELLVRGPMVTKGYYAAPEKTAEAYLDGGWFATGDVGSISADGCLHIVGRVEALVKNANGEYIAVEALEGVYSLHPLANPNSVCVLVDPHKSYISGIVLTDMAKAMEFAHLHGLAGEWPAILEDEAFRRAVVKSFRKLGRKSRLRPFELLADIAVIHDEWTPENGCLTAAMKMKRSVILERHAEAVKRLFVK